MENQNPLEMQNPDLNPHQPPHLSAKAHCVFCGANLTYSAEQCPACGAQAEHAKEPAEQVFDNEAQATSYEDPVKKPRKSARGEAIKSRLDPDHSKPIDKRKLIYSIIIIILALIVIGLLGKQ